MNSRSRDNTHSISALIWCWTHCSSGTIRKWWLLWWWCKTLPPEQALGFESTQSRPWKMLGKQHRRVCQFNKHWLLRPYFYKNCGRKCTGSGKYSIISSSNAFCVGTCGRRAFHCEPSAGSIKILLLIGSIDRWQKKKNALSIPFTQASVVKYKTRKCKRLNSSLAWSHFISATSPSRNTFFPLTDTLESPTRSRRTAFSQKIAYRGARSRTTIRSIHVKK